MKIILVVICLLLFSHVTSATEPPTPDILLQRVRTDKGGVIVTLGFLDGMMAVIEGRTSDGGDEVTVFYPSLWGGKEEAERRIRSITDTGPRQFFWPQSAKVSWLPSDPKKIRKVAGRDDEFVLRTKKVLIPTAKSGPLPFSFKESSALYDDPRGLRGLEEVAPYLGVITNSPIRVAEGVAHRDKLGRWYLTTSKNPEPPFWAGNYFVPISKSK